MKLLGESGLTSVTTAEVFWRIVVVDVYTYSGTILGGPLHCTSVPHNFPGTFGFGVAIVTGEETDAWAITFGIKSVRVQVSTEATDVAENDSPLVPTPISRPALTRNLIEAFMLELNSRDPLED